MTKPVHNSVNYSSDDDIAQITILIKENITPRALRECSLRTLREFKRVISHARAETTYFAEKKMKKANKTK